MKRIVPGLLTGFVLLAMASCQREYTFTETPLSPPVDDSIVLLKYLEVDSVAGALTDTSLIVEFTYDNLGRLTATHSVFSTDPADNASFFERQTYFYNNTDTLPYKYVSYSQETPAPGSVYVDTFFYTFNSAGKLIQDSLMNYSGTNSVYSLTKKYQYFDNYVVVNQQDSLLRTDTVYLSTVNGNITNQHSTVYYVSPSPNSIVSDFNYQYDTHPNPFYIPAYYSTRPLTDFEDDTYNTPQKNNYVNMSQAYGAGVNNSTQCSYVYKTNGYPLYVYKTYFATTTPGSTTEYVKGIFIYGRR